MDWFERLTGFRDVNAEHDGLPIGQDAPAAPEKRFVGAFAVRASGRALSDMQRTQNESPSNL